MKMTWLHKCFGLFFITADGWAKSAQQLISTVLPFHPLYFPRTENSTQPSLNLFHRTWVLFKVQRTDPLTERTNDGKMNDYNLPIYTIHISSTLNSKKNCTYMLRWKISKLKEVLNEIAPWIDFTHQAFIILSIFVILVKQKQYQF